MPILHRLLLVTLLVGCEVGDELDPIDESTAIIAAGGDPCKDPNIRSRATVTKPNAEGNFVGTNKRDVILGTNGPDKIYGLGGDDLICGFDGDDYIDGGDGRDAIHAGAGDDIVHGRGGSDAIWGGAGTDILFGDILDDTIHGDGGNDTLIGGHGTDTMYGEAGNDFFRGDTGNDFFYGGDGNDVVSFATALPPGQPEVKNDGSLNPIMGVSVDFNGQCNGGGCADGDGGNEPLGDIEQVVGSPFADRINAGGRTVQSSAPPVATMTVYLAVAKDPGGRIADLGVVVLGDAGNNSLDVTGNDYIVDVAANGALTAGEGCANQGPNNVRCDIGAYLANKEKREHPFHFVSVWGDDGNDTINIRGDFPRELEAHASGGKGSDHIVGGKEQDVFFTGVTGEDWLEGNDGDDALLSESQHTLAWRNGNRPEASQYNDGGDTLDAGPGNDQLVADYVCGGHRYIGGPGRDIAGFARSGNPAINAQLGGPAKTKTRWWGKAANMNLCGNLPGRWTTFKTGVDADLEVLEASDGPDHLWGDDRANVLWGRGGGDVVYGLGGDDEILGADGNDKLYGGEGNNTIKYGAGN